MSVQTEHRGFTIGRQVGVCRHWTRFVFGLLGLVSVGTQVVHLGPSAVLIERLAGGLLLTTALLPLPASGSLARGYRTPGSVR